MKKEKRALTLTVDKKNCKIVPPGKVHAAAKKHGGYVVFNAVSACQILFTNPSVFGRQFLNLKKGANKHFIKVDRGHTLVMISGCEYKIPRSLGAASNPNDIIVP